MPRTKPPTITTAGKSRNQVRDEILALAKTRPADFLTLMADQPRVKPDIAAAFLTAAEILCHPNPPTTTQIADRLEQALGPRYRLGVEQRQINPVLRALRGET